MNSAAASSSATSPLPAAYTRVAHPEWGKGGLGLITYASFGNGPASAGAVEVGDKRDVCVKKFSSLAGIPLSKGRKFEYVAIRYNTLLWAAASSAPVTSD